jgi:NAD dependent epimerase/dehydratase
MQLASRHVLVTGAGGFVGSHLVERLVAEGCAVRCLIYDDGSGSWGLLEDLPAATQERLEVIWGDLRDARFVHRAAADIDVIFHLAALTSVPYSFEHPHEVIENNVMSTLNVLEAARQSRVSRVVHASTSDVYGTARYVPIDEGHPLQGQSPYAASKIGAEKIAESFHRSYGLPVVVLRPFNIFGPRQSTRAVIPAIITQALTTNVVRLGALTPTRDFTYVVNTVDAYVRAAKTEEAVGGVFNIGSNIELSIAVLARTIVQLVGREVRLVSEEAAHLRPPGSEVRRVCAANDLARRVLGWTPQITFEEGLRHTIDWIATHLDRYQPGYTI